MAKLEEGGEYLMVANSGSDTTSIFYVKVEEVTSLSYKFNYANGDIFWFKQVPFDNQFDIWEILTRPPEEPAP